MIFIILFVSRDCPDLAADHVFAFTILFRNTLALGRVLKETAEKNVVKCYKGRSVNSIVR